MPPPKFHIEAIEHLRTDISPFIRRTPLLQSLFSDDLFLKAENLQNTNSFKVRAAAGQILSLSQAQRDRGLVTSSSGNFGQAAAYVASLMGCSLQVVMTRNSNPLKVELTRKWGAEVVFCDNAFGARQARVEKIESTLGAIQIHPFNHPNAVLGNASLGLEVMEQKADIQHLVVPISGGGLISGAALGAKLRNPSIQVWGVQPQGSNATYLSFRAGRILSVEKTDTIADGLRVNRPGELTFSLIQHYVDSVITVSEQGILEAMAHFFQTERLVVEPSGAVGMAAVLEGSIPARNTVLILSGGNVDPDLLAEALSGSTVMH